VDNKLTRDIIKRLGSKTLKNRMELMRGGKGRYQIILARQIVKNKEFILAA
jgi:hypothetical protein